MSPVLKLVHLRAHLSSKCKQNTVKFFGVGTQRLELILSKLFPKAKILRYDRDAVSKKNLHYTILNKFENQENMSFILFSIKI